MVVGVSRVDLFFPENHSLKDKRQMLKKVIEKTRARFNISVIEVEQSNLWQRARIGFAVAGVRQDHVNKVIENVHGFIEELYLGEVIDTSTEIIVIGDRI
ncbi:MAG TPA: DUF503 domain-containing protein [Syntrophorhabdaceae bacterium]|nr:DUF503 domain-containing protein [Syntrophorhabdaceae bacterium]